MKKKATLNELCDDLTIGKGILYIPIYKKNSFPNFFLNWKRWNNEKNRKNSSSAREN